MQTILGRKVGMTRVFDEKGSEIPVSVIEVGPCQVTQLKSLNKDSYTAVQVGFDPVKESHVKKPILGHLKKSGAGLFRVLREFRVKDEAVLSQYKLGQEIRVDIFKDGDVVDVIGISKGRGFQGVVKRHGFRGLRATHGNNEYFRRPGSIGTNTYGSNTKRGKKLPGHYGNEKKTILSVKVVKVDSQENLLLVQGGIPGAKGGLICIRKSER